MYRIIKEVSSLNMGYRMGQNKRISMVCYADDAAIFVETEDDLQRQLRNLCQDSQAMSMTISIEKTKSIQTCIRPIMTYGIETREETNKTKRMLRIAQMKTLRTVMGKTGIPIGKRAPGRPSK